MTLLNSALIIFALCLDTFFIALSYGAGGIKLPVLSCAVICAVSAASITLSACAGGLLTNYLPGGAVKILGFLVLLSVGIFKAFDTAVTAFIEKAKRRTINLKTKRLIFVFEIDAAPERADADRSNTISVREAFLLSIAVSMDGLLAGISLNTRQTPPFLIFAIGFAIALICLLSGRLIGKRLSNGKRGVLSFLGGAILILLAITRLF